MPLGTALCASLTAADCSFPFPIHRFKPALPPNCKPGGFVQLTLAALEASNEVLAYNMPVSVALQRGRLHPLKVADWCTSACGTDNEANFPWLAEWTSDSEPTFPSSEEALSALANLLWFRRIALIVIAADTWKVSVPAHVDVREFFADPAGKAAVLLMYPHNEIEFLRGSGLNDVLSSQRTPMVLQVGLQLVNDQLNSFTHVIC